MNVYCVKLTQQAEEHIREIEEYIVLELHNPVAAGNLLDSFSDAFETLEKNPERHALVDEEPWRSEGIRKVSVKHFLICFWIDVENAAVQIIGIVYARRDQKKFLKQLK